MDLNFDRLHKIYLEHGNEGLELEKQRLLNEYLETVPQEKRQALKTFDKQIQGELIGLTNEQKIKKIGSMMVENLFDLCDNMADLSFILNSNENDSKKK